jgi:hypothetical protein
MVKTFDILLDIEKEIYSPSNLLFSVSINDLNNVQLNFVITQDGAPIDLTNTTIELAVKKPSGLATYQDCEITSAIEGKATVLLSLQAYDEYGIYTAEVYVKEIDNLSVTSPFYYQSKSAVLETEVIGGGGSSYFIFGDGAPINAPARVGQIYIDQLNKSAYIATGEIVEDWEPIDNEQIVKEAITWGEILEKPTTFAPEVHGHEVIDILGLQEILDLKADDIDLMTKANIADVYTKLETYNKTEIEGLVTGGGGETVVEDNLTSINIDTALSANQGRILNETKADKDHVHDYAPETHNHLVAEIEGLQTELDSKADINHNHDATYSPINHNHDATYSPINHNHDATYSPIIHSHTWGEILEKPTTFAPENHNHVIGEITGLQTELDSKADIIPPNEIILNATTLTNAVQLDWEIGTATSWAIYRSEISGKLGEKLVGDLITNTYTDSTALGGTTYYYTLQIEDVSQKTISDQVEATPYSITVYGSKRVEFSGYAGWTVYGDAQATADFGNQFTLQGGDRLKIDTGEKLRFYMPVGQVGSANTGGIIKANIAGKTDYTIEYGIRFDSPFPWSKGGKVPGFSGGAGYTGGKPAWDGDGFSVRLMWREGGRIIPYLYHYNQPDEFGDTFGETLGYFTDTKEHIVKYYAVLNTGANPDGILKIYLDGVQVFDKRDLIYRTDESLIDTAHLAIFAGGSDASWNMTADGYIRLNYFDWK